MKAILIIAAVFSQSPIERNPFSSEQWSSAAISVAWNSCLTKAKGSLGADVASNYCACATDTMRAKGQQNVTQGDLRQCTEYAEVGMTSDVTLLRSGHRSFWESFTEDKDGWNTVEIIRAIAQCESTSEYANANVRWAYCGCLVDGRRSRAKTFSEDKVFSDNHNPNEIDTCVRRAARYEPKPKQEPAKPVERSKHMEPANGVKWPPPCTKYSRGLPGIQ